MFILVLTDNIVASRFLTRGLKYENIYSEPKTFNDDWLNFYVFHSYSAVVTRITSKTQLNEKLIHEIKDASQKCPVFIIDNNIKTKECFCHNNQIYILKKDISLRILAIEIKSIVAKIAIENKPKKLTVCDLELNPYTREAHRYGKKFNLRNKEFQLLEFLMINTDHVLTRQKILENVWDRNANLFTNTVDVHINNLRRKLDYDKQNQLIETIYCLGYIMHSKPTDKE